MPRLIPVGGRPWAPLAAGSVVWFNEDDPALTVSLVDALRQAGLRPRHAPCAELAHLTPEESLGGLLLIAPLGEVGADFLFHALRAVQHFGPALRRSRGVLLTVSRLDGGFGLLELDPRRLPLDGALAGLSKTVGHEWGEVRARAVDVSPQMQPHQAAQALVEELGRLDPVEVGLTPDRHWAVQRVLAPLSPDDVGVGFEPGEVIVVSGGARGVTAEVAAALAEAYRPTLVLLGRSPTPEHEPGWLTPLRTETEIKRELASRGLSSLRAISERCNTVLAGRAIRNTLERLAARGARVIYHAVDVRDPVAVTRLLEEIRRQYGPIRGLIHGAGVLADARIEDKTREPFDRVWKTKVDGLLHLLAGVGEDLRALVLFSSSTARFGRAGQVDYAMANEALNKIARQEALRRPGCRVVSLNWGPWAGGMVTPELARRFAEDGVGLIPPESGAAFFLDELRGREIEVVVLAESPGLPRAKASDSVEPEATVLTTQAPALPPALPTCFERLVDLNTFPVLGSHILDGRPVVPLALLLEWLAHAALHQHPGLKFHGCDNLQLLQGVIVDSVAPKVRVGAGKGCLRDGLLVVPAEVRSVRPDGKERLHARAEVILADELSEALPPRGAPVLAPTALTPAEAYSGMLFHGPDLHGLEHLDGLDGRGIAGRARVAPPPASWLLQPLRQRWITDPLVLDTAFQMMIIWSMKQRGAASLPSRVGRYRQYQTAFPAPSVSVAAQVTRSSEAIAVANVEFLTPDGRIIAEMEHYECIIDASLGRAFRRPRPSHARR